VTLRRIALLACGCALFVAAIPVAQNPSWAGSIVGTKHDLSGKEWGTGEVCKFCHTPHNAKSPQDAPLWNHASTSASYTLYSSPTMDVPVGQPGKASKTCLSCHDGTVALDSFGNNTGTHLISGTSNLGTDLSDDHPIGIEWQHQNQPPAACANCHGSMHVPFTRVLPFYSRRVECGSCHNPHNNDLTKFLRMTVVGSEICLHCHNK